MMPDRDYDERIRRCEDDVKSLRQRTHDGATEMTALRLDAAEMKLNLAHQDKTLGKIVSCLEGNGQPGLKTRIDRVEQVQAQQARAQDRTRATVRWVIGLGVSIAGVVVAWVLRH